MAVSVIRSNEAISYTEWCLKVFDGVAADKTARVICHDSRAPSYLLPDDFIRPP